MKATQEESVDCLSLLEEGQEAARRLRNQTCALVESTSVFFGYFKRKDAVQYACSISYWLLVKKIAHCTEKRVHVRRELKAKGHSRSVFRNREGSFALAMPHVCTKFITEESTGGERRPRHLSVRSGGPPRREVLEVYVFIFVLVGFKVLIL